MFLVFSSLSKVIAHPITFLESDRLTQITTVDLKNKEKEQ